MKLVKKYQLKKFAKAKKIVIKRIRMQFDRKNPKKDEIWKKKTF